jgi:hypothetical protein
MAQSITVHRTGGRKILINTACVILVEQDAEGSRLLIRGWTKPIHVDETIEQIDQMMGQGLGVSGRRP